MSNKPVIVFEGIEGSGKSHHILRISKYLKKKELDLLKCENLVGASMLKKLENLFLIINLHLVKKQIYYFI